MSAADHAMRKRLASLIEPKTVGLDTPIELASVPRHGPFRVPSGCLEPIEFPTREQSRVVKMACAAARFEEHHPMAAWAICVAFSGAVMLASAVIGGGQ